MLCYDGSYQIKVVDGEKCRLPRCPVCQETFHRYFILSKDAKIVEETWKADGFFEQLNEAKLFKFYEKVWSNHKAEGYETKNLHSLKKQSDTKDTDRKILIQGIAERIKDAMMMDEDGEDEDDSSSVGEDSAMKGGDERNSKNCVRECCGMVDALDYFFPVEVMPQTLKNDVAKLFKSIYVDPLLRVKSETKQQKDKREALRLIAIRKERETAQKQHDASRKKLSKAENKKGAAGKKTTAAKETNRATKKKSKKEDDDEPKGGKSINWAARIKEEQKKIKELQKAEEKVQKQREKEQKKVHQEEESAHEQRRAEGFLRILEALTRDHRSWSNGFGSIVRQNLLDRDSDSDDGFDY